jgi:hypothetical protein
LTLFLMTSFWHTFCGVGVISFSLCIGDNTFECDFVERIRRFSSVTILWLRRLMWDCFQVLNNIEFSMRDFLGSCLTHI